jgi:hypothetical protein
MLETAGYLWKLAPRWVSEGRVPFMATALNVGFQDSLANSLQGHADNPVASACRHFSLPALARGVAATPIPSDKANHPSHANPPIAGRHLPVA